MCQGKNALGGRKKGVMNKIECIKNKMYNKMSSLCCCIIIIQIKANKKTVLFSEEFLLIVPTFQ